MSIALKFLFSFLVIYTFFGWFANKADKEKKPKAFLILGAPAAIGLIGMFISLLFWIWGF